MSYGPEICHANGGCSNSPEVGWSYCKEHLQQSPQHPNGHVVRSGYRRFNLDDYAPTKEDVLRHDMRHINSMSEERFLKPDHYAYSDHEPDDVIEAWGLSYRLGQVLRYLCRCDRKKNKMKDLKKAQWYLNREIERLENA